MDGVKKYCYHCGKALTNEEKCENPDCWYPSNAKNDEYGIWIYADRHASDKVKDLLIDNAYKKAKEFLLCKLTSYLLIVTIIFSGASTAISIINEDKNEEYINSNNNNNIVFFTNDDIVYHDENNILMIDDEMEDIENYNGEETNENITDEEADYWKYFPKFEKMFSDYGTYIKGALDNSDFYIGTSPIENGAYYQDEKYRNENGIEQAIGSIGPSTPTTDGYSYVYCFYSEGITTKDVLEDSRIFAKLTLLYKDDKFYLVSDDPVNMTIGEINSLEK